MNETRGQKPYRRVITAILAAALITAACSPAAPSAKRAATENSAAAAGPVQISTEGLTVAEDLDRAQLEEMATQGVTFYDYPQTNQLRRIEGAWTDTKILDEKDALQALSGVRGLFGITSMEFTCLLAEKRRSWRVFDLQQLYRGVPVEDGRFRVVAHLDGTADEVSGYYVQNLDLDVTPALTAEECLERAGLQSSDGEDAHLCIIEEKDGGHLSWKVPLASEDVYLDAGSGKTLREVATVIN